MFVHPSSVNLDSEATIQVKFCPELLLEYTNWCHRGKNPVVKKAFWAQCDDHMGLLCLQLHPYFSCFTSNVLPNQLACPFAFKVGLDLRIALHHNLAKRAIAGPR